MHGKCQCIIYTTCKLCLCKCRGLQSTVKRAPYSSNASIQFINLMTKYAYIYPSYKVNSVTACPVISDSANIFLFSLRSKNLINKEDPMLIKENTIISIMASAYRGESPGRKKYGLQMLPSWASKLTIAVPAARFSGVWFSVLAAHE